MNPTWKLHLIANTHWDREWYMGFERYRLRLVQLMDRLVSLLQKDASSKNFLLDGQYIAIQDYLEIRPEQEAAIRQLVSAGRLQIGPWYTQPHETLVSGESLIRNLMLGIRASRNLGEATLISYTIDQFGHASQIPQILKGFDIESSVAWRGVPQGMKSVFVWKGPDGSEVTFFYSNNGYGHATALPKSLENFTETYEKTVFPRSGLRQRVEELIALRSPNTTTPHLMCLNGIDHSFAQENLAEIVDLINSECKHVEAVQSSMAEYIAEVIQTHKQDGIKLDTHTGELFDSNQQVLKDVHSFRPDLKLANRRVEGMLEKWTEPFAAFAWRMELAQYPGAEINKAWKYVLENQSHDSIACSSVDKVYRHVMARYDWAEDIADDIAARSLISLISILSADSLSDSDCLPLIVFNPLSQSRDEEITTIMDIPKSLNWNSFVITGENGACPAILQDLGDARHVRYNPFRGHSTVVPVRRWRVVFKAGEVPMLGYSRFRIRKGAPAMVNGASMFTSPSVMENESLRVSVKPNGTFDVFHKPSESAFPGLHYFEDSGEAGDGYFHHPPAENRILLSIGSRAEISIIRDTPLEAAIEIRQIFEVPAELENNRTLRSRHNAACEIRSVLTLTAGSSRLDIRTSIINRAKDHRMRVLFPTNLAVNNAVSEQPFDEVSRPVTAGGKEINSHQPFDDVSRPACVLGTEIHAQQSYVDVNDGKVGFMIANTGIYEYELMRDSGRTLALTLLRCTDRLDRGTFIDSEYLIPQGQCLGEYTFDYSVIPYCDRSSARIQAYAFAFPLRTVLHREPELSALPGFEQPVLSQSVPESGSFLEIMPDSVVVSAIKKNEDRETLVVRLLNISDEAVDATLCIAIPGWKPSYAWETNLNEERISPLSLAPDGCVSVKIRPRGLFTIEVS